MNTKYDSTRILLSALGIDSVSFTSFLEWALCEHLVYVMKKELEDVDFSFQTLNSLREFRDILRKRTQKRWIEKDLNKLYQRVRQEMETQFREPVPYSEYLKLLWQVPLECAKCKRKPPEVVLHIDHIHPASKGGKSTRSNLQFLCEYHNLEKSNRIEEGERWLELH